MHARLRRRSAPEVRSRGLRGAFDAAATQPVQRGGAGVPRVRAVAGGEHPAADGLVCGQPQGARRAHRARKYCPVGPRETDRYF